MPRSLVLVVAIAACLARGATAQEPFYTPLAPAYPLFGVSGDGKRALGLELVGPYSSLPVYWDGFPQLGPFGPEPVPLQTDFVEGTYVTARFASFDGATIAGESFPVDDFGSLQNAPTGGYRWNAIDGLSWLPGFDTPPTRFAGISSDGSTILGMAGGKAARWDAGVLTILTPAGHPNGLPATLLALRPDGRVIGAANPDAAGSVPPLFLTDGATVEALWFPDVADLHATRASADGSVVVGYYRDPRAYVYPFRWSDRPYPHFAQLTTWSMDAKAIGVSADGTVIVGNHDDDADGVTDAFVWTPAAGLRNLHDILEEAGFPHYQREWSADDVSSDGTIVVGIRQFFDGFIAGLPQPVPEPDLVASALAALIALGGLVRLHSAS